MFSHTHPHSNIQNLEAAQCKQSALLSSSTAAADRLNAQCHRNWAEKSLNFIGILGISEFSSGRELNLVHIKFNFGQLWHIYFQNVQNGGSYRSLLAVCSILLNLCWGVNCSTAETRARKNTAWDYSPICNQANKCTDWKLAMFNFGFNFDTLPLAKHFVRLFLQKR